MVKSIIWTVIFSTFAAILQSTLIGMVPVFKVVPDLALCVLVFSAYVNGTMTGQVSGFFSGLFLDFLSAAPLGMNCFIRTITGAVAGIFKGRFFLDYIIMPAILCALATILKAVLVFILHLFMGSEVPAYSLIKSLFWIELGLNTLFGPLIFLILRKFRPIFTGRN